MARKLMAKPSSKKPVNSSNSMHTSHSAKSNKSIKSNKLDKLNKSKSVKDALTPEKVEQPILILCIDRDNDLYEKAGISGPLIGRQKNVEGATKLAIADPEEPDANVMFSGIKLYDKMKSDGINVELVTLTGSKNLGYASDFEISRQLDDVIVNLHPKSAILVTDGKSDEEIIPVIRSRIPLDSTQVIFIKQAKELEKTYFVLIEKLKDPHYAKILIGIPAFFIFFLSLFLYLGYGWELFGMLLGLYAILHLFKIDSWVYSVIKDFDISFDKIGWMGYLVAFVLFLIGIFSAYESYIFAQPLIGTLGEMKIIAYVTSNVTYLFGISILVFIISKIVDSLYESKKFIIGRYSIYFGVTLFTIFIVKMIADWIFNPAPEVAKLLSMTPTYVSFFSIINALVIILFLGYIFVVLIKKWQMKILEEQNIIGKHVVTMDGNLLGVVSNLDESSRSISISDIYNKRKKFNISMNDIIDVDKNIIVRY